MSKYCFLNTWQYFGGCYQYHSLCCAPSLLSINYFNQAYYIVSGIGLFVLLSSKIRSSSKYLIWFPLYILHICIFFPEAKLKNYVFFSRT